MFRALYIGITKTKVLTMSAVVMAAVNVILDYVLVFGEWGFPEMGCARGGTGFGDSRGVFAGVLPCIYLCEDRPS